MASHPWMQPRELRESSHFRGPDFRILENKSADAALLLVNDGAE